MLPASKSPAVLLLIALLGPAARPARPCGLNHCPRPGLAVREQASLAWSVDHTELAPPSGSGSFTQGALHLRVPLGARAVLGGHLPFGYLRSATEGHWGLANPMTYGEWRLRPAAAQALTLGLQFELPFGDVHGGIASEHAMAMPYAAYVYRGGLGAAQASLGFASRLPGGHAHAAAAVDHSAHGGPAAPLEAKPHAPYELLYRISLALPREAFRMEPEAFLSGARVAFAGAGEQVHHLGLGAALGLRVSRSLLLKPRWERQLTHPARFGWSTGLDARVDL
jgi:hypothetical protein